jgi:pimeloyl-ACP methyl ester carboxylesterase
VDGASDQRPASVTPTSETFARELHSVLANANVPGPYLLAGTSLGGLLIADFAARYPSEVAGLVFIDGIAPGSVESWLSELLSSTEPWDGSADVGLLRGLSFGSRPVVALATAQPAEIPISGDARRTSSSQQRRGTGISSSSKPQGSRTRRYESRPPHCVPAARYRRARRRHCRRSGRSAWLDLPGQFHSSAANREPADSDRLRSIRAPSSRVARRNSPRPQVLQDAPPGKWLEYLPSKEVLDVVTRLCSSQTRGFLRSWGQILGTG